MNNFERFTRVFEGRKDYDHLPAFEWADWWSKTVDAWHAEGLPENIAGQDLKAYWKHDMTKHFWLPIREPEFPTAPYHGGPVMENEDDYEKLRKMMFTDRVLDILDKTLSDFVAEHKDDDIAYWFAMEGFFWFPRKLFGIENHFWLGVKCIDT